MQIEILVLIIVATEFDEGGEGGAVFELSGVQDVLEGEPVTVEYRKGRTDGYARCEQST